MFISSDFPLSLNLTPPLMAAAMALSPSLVFSLSSLSDGHNCNQTYWGNSPRRSATLQSSPLYSNKNQMTMLWSQLTKEQGHSVLSEFVGLIPKLWPFLCFVHSMQNIMFYTPINIFLLFDEIYRIFFCVISLHTETKLWFDLIAYKNSLVLPSFHSKEPMYT